MNYELGNEMWKDELINMTRAWDTEFFIVIHNAIDIADPSRKRDTCHIWTPLNGLFLREFS